MDVNPEWVEAGARAIGAHRKGHGWERDEDTWRNYTQIVEWALTAVEPLIRADEREKVYAEFQFDYADEVVLKTLRAQIAADIEEFRVSLPIETPALSGTVRDRDDMSWVLAMVRDRVARGEQEAK
jgi:hypothetical protein